MLYTDVYTAAHLMCLTTATVYRWIHAGRWWAEGIIHRDKKILLPLSKVAHMTERAEADLAEEIKLKPRLCLLDLPEEEVRRLKRAGLPKARKREWGYPARRLDESGEGQISLKGWKC